MGNAKLIKEKIKKFCCQLTFEERMLSLKRLFFSLNRLRKIESGRYIETLR
jgi:hypothetical protein